MNQSSRITGDTVFRKLPSCVLVELKVAGVERTLSFGDFEREYFDTLNDTDYAILQEGCIRGNFVPVGDSSTETPLGTLRVSKSKLAFLVLQEAAEAIELANAQEHDTPEQDETLKVIDVLMEASPWTLRPDEGCVLKNAANDGQAALQQG